LRITPVVVAVNVSIVICEVALAWRPTLVHCPAAPAPKLLFGKWLLQMSPRLTSVREPGPGIRSGNPAGPGMPG